MFGLLVGYKWGVSLASNCKVLRAEADLGMHQELVLRKLPK